MAKTGTFVTKWTMAMNVNTQFYVCHEILIISNL